MLTCNFVIMGKFNNLLMFDNIRQHETKTLGIIWAGSVSRHSSQSHRLIIKWKQFDKAFNKSSKIARLGFWSCDAIKWWLQCWKVWQISHFCIWREHLACSISVECNLYYTWSCKVQRMWRFCRYMLLHVVTD